MDGNKIMTVSHIIKTNMAHLKKEKIEKKRSGHPWYGGKSIGFKQMPTEKEILVAHDQACVIVQKYITRERQKVLTAGSRSSLGGRRCIKRTQL